MDSAIPFYTPCSVPIAAACRLGSLDCGLKAEEEQKECNFHSLVTWTFAPPFQVILRAVASDLTMSALVRHLSDLSECNHCEEVFYCGVG